MKNVNFSNRTGNQKKKMTRKRKKNSDTQDADKSKAGGHAGERSCTTCCSDLDRFLLLLANRLINCESSRRPESQAHLPLSQQEEP